MLDFHTHTTLSDGALLPAELIQRAQTAGYRAVGLTDHIDAGTLEFTLSTLQRTCRETNPHTAIVAIPGVEITHVPPATLADCASAARAMGARLVIVHGESIVEPVPPGTNAAAVEADIDLLAHPGLIDEETVRTAKKRGIFLELSARRGHCLGNGRLVQWARKLDALDLLVISSDAHTPEDLLNPERQHAVALGAGLTEREYEQIRMNLTRLLERIT